MASTALATRLPLHNGLSIPQIHLGVYRLSGREAYHAVQTALAAGYRGIDSAQMYHNEEECGSAIRDFLADPSLNSSGLTREDIFYTSKLASNSDYATARASIHRSVELANLGYVDMFLLHSPYGGKAARLASWRALEDAVADGEVKIAGISNYGQGHIEELLATNPAVRPSVNQIEVHPFNARLSLTEFCRSKGLVVEAYAPLARATRMRDKTVLSLSNKYGCTPAQLMVKWSIQHGHVPLPKSTKKERILENAKVDFFEIDKADMLKLDSLDEELVTDWDPLDAP